MSAREHELDRVARAMTSGAPGETFTARVMAPLRGLPQPGFRDRVMAQLDTARPNRRPRALQAALAGAAAVAILMSLWTARWSAGGGALPVTHAPVLVNARVGEPAFAIPARVFRSLAAPPPARSPMTPAVPASAPRALFVTDAVPALAAPAGISLTSIEPPPAAVPTLSRPAPLSISPLRIEKEKP